MITPMPQVTGEFYKRGCQEKTVLHCTLGMVSDVQPLTSTAVVCRALLSSIGTSRFLPSGPALRRGRVVQPVPDGFSRRGGPSIPLSLHEQGGTFGHALDFSARCFPLNSLRFPATPCAILEDGGWSPEAGGWNGERRSNLKSEISDLRDGNGIEVGRTDEAEMQIPSKDSGQTLPASG